MINNKENVCDKMVNKKQDSNFIYKIMSTMN
jgi:hypothetical protein